MNKEELLEKIATLSAEVRSIADEFTDGSKDVADINARLDAKKEELRKAKMELVQADAPVEKVETRSCWIEIAQAMKEKRTVTVSGTGMTKTVKELVKLVQKDDSILARVRFFYGANANTIIPVWAENIVAQFITEGGSADPDSANLGTSAVIPKEAFASLPVSDATLDLSAVELAAELPEIFANAMAGLMAEKMMTGDGTNMQGIFTDSGVTAYESTLTIDGLSGLALKLKEKKYRNPCIVMNSVIYKQFVKDVEGEGKLAEIYKEDLVKNKMIEEVPIILSPYAPITYTTGSKVAIGGDLGNYAIGVAGQLKIKQKEKAGTSAVFFDGYEYFSGKPIIASDFYAFKVTNA